MDSQKYIANIQKVLTEAIAHARQNQEGLPADYIPELASVDPDYTAGAIALADGGVLFSGDDSEHKFTIQSVSKVVLFIGLLEEFGVNRVFTWIDAEPSGKPFSSISHLDSTGPIPSNPMVNSGAIALASHIPGDTISEQKAWIHRWTCKCFGEELNPNLNVFNSEKMTGDRNRALAYLMKSTGVLARDVDDILEVYFMLCSYELNIKQASYLPMILANGGLSPEGERIISEQTSNCVVSVMTTCGLYDESGTHLVQIGMPAKSGVSGLMIAVATGRAGVALFSPRLNKKGNSIRAQLALAELSRQLDWHFAAPWGYARVDSTLHPSDF